MTHFRTHKRSLSTTSLQSGRAIHLTADGHYLSITAPFPTFKRIIYKQ